MYFLPPRSLLLSGSSTHHVSSSSTKLKREKTARITPKGQQLQPSLNTFGIPVLRPSGLRVTWALPASGEPAWTSVFRPAKPMWASVTGVGFSPQHAPLRPDELATSCRLRPRYHNFTKMLWRAGIIPLASGFEGNPINQPNYFIWLIAAFLFLYFLKTFVT